MNGIHDLGGMHGFGPVRRTAADEVPFSEAWEGRVHGLLLALAVNGALPSGFRHAIERMPAHLYLTTAYYEHWLHALETLLAEAGTLERPPAAPRAPDDADLVRSLFGPGAPRERPEPERRFGVGDEVVVRRDAPPGHTRCPRYIRGARGRVLRLLPVTPVHDALPELRPEPAYTVAFDGAELWGDAAEPNTTVTVDLWECHLR